MRATLRRAQGERRVSNSDDIMKIQSQSALVTGGASGLGAATARELARRGAKVAVLDVNLELAQKVAAEIGGIAIRCDITDTASVTAALDAAEAAHGPARIVMNIAGIGTAKRVVQKDGSPAPLEDFERVIRVNLIGTYNVIRLAAARIVKLEPLEDGERGVFVNTASAAAFDGQVGQEAYRPARWPGRHDAAARARPGAVRRARLHHRPGLFLTPLLAELPMACRSRSLRAFRSPSAWASRRIRPPGGEHRREPVAQRRGDPPRWRPAHGCALN